MQNPWDAELLMGHAAYFHKLSEVHLETDYARKGKMHATAPNDGEILRQLSDRCRNL